MGVLFGPPTTLFCFKLLTFAGAFDLLTLLRTRVVHTNHAAARTARRSFPAQVFVLTESKEADQKEALRRVRELALSRCGVEVKATPWLEGRPALDEFLDNHRGVLDLIIRHRLACGMWCVYSTFFSAMLSFWRVPFSGFSGFFSCRSVVAVVASFSDLAGWGVLLQ